MSKLLTSQSKMQVNQILLVVEEKNKKKCFPTSGSWQYLERRRWSPSFSRSPSLKHSPVPLLVGHRNHILNFHLICLCRKIYSQISPYPSFRLRQSNTFSAKGVPPHTPLAENHFTKKTLAEMWDTPSPSTENRRKFSVLKKGLKRAFFAEFFLIPHPLEGKSFGQKELSGAGEYLSP